MSFADLSKTFGQGKGRINAREELDALETEYENLFGVHPEFDVIRHRNKSVYMDELKKSITTCKRELAYA